jgi:hypothetical protein
VRADFAFRHANQLAAGDLNSHIALTGRLPDDLSLTLDSGV